MKCGNEKKFYGKIVKLVILTVVDNYSQKNTVFLRTIRGRPYMTSDGRGGGGVQPNLIL